MEFKEWWKGIKKEKIQREGKRIKIIIRSKWSRRAQIPREWKCDWIGPSYSSRQSERREEILRWGKGSNDFERIEWGAIWGKNLMYDFLEWQ